MKFPLNNPKLKQRRCDLRKNQTEPEKALWQQLRNRKLNGLKFYRQYSVGPYILDLYCPEVRLAIELDGGQHADGDARDYDEYRSEYLRTLGIETVRFWNNDVMNNMEGVLNRITEQIGLLLE